MSDVRVLFSGAAGRMGRALVPGIRAADGIDLVAEVDIDDDLAAAIRESNADVVVDFTTPAAAMPNARTILAAGAHGVIGTTGFSTDDLDALDAEAQSAGKGLLIAANFSLGMILLQRFAEEAVRHFPRTEIIEAHHEGKRDAPSGTSLRTAERLAGAGAQPGPGGGDEARGTEVGGVRIHSLRMPGIHAQQEVRLAGPHETLTLQHAALSRECYLAGVLEAIRAVPAHTGLIRGLDPILFADS